MTAGGNLSGKKNVVFPAVLQAFCSLTTVLGESCLQGKLGSTTVSRDPAVPHFSRAPHAKLPARNKTHSVPGGTAWPVVWGGSETIHGWQGRKNLNFKVSGNGLKASFLYPRDRCNLPSRECPTACKQCLCERAQVVLGSPISLLPPPVNGTQAKLWAGTELSLSPICGCAFFCFTALMLYGLQEFYSPENSSSCEDATRMSHVWRYPWAELPEE